MFITLFSYLSTAALRGRHFIELRTRLRRVPCYCTHRDSWEQRRWWLVTETPLFGSFCTFCSPHPGLRGLVWLKEGCSVEENHSWLHSWKKEDMRIRPEMKLLGIITYKNKNIPSRNCDWNAQHSSRYQNLLRGQTITGRTLGQMRGALWTCPTVIKVECYKHWQNNVYSFSSGLLALFPKTQINLVKR